jgi:transcriptional regulator with XRE-family HTH domain
MEKKIAEQIKQIRESRGFSQEYMSKKLGITQQAYSVAEKKPEKLTLERLQNIADILNVTIISLLEEGEYYLQHNFNQQGGNAATQMIIHQANNETIQLYERYIAELKNEIQFLRRILDNTSGIKSGN